MQEILITKSWKNRFKELIMDRVNYCYSDGLMHVTLLKNDFQITCRPVYTAASSQNEVGDEICFTKFKEESRTYVPSKEDALIVNDEVLTNIYVAQTIVHFTDYAEYIPPEKPVSVVDKQGGYLGGHNECLTNPNSETANRINSEFANYVEAGILLEFGQHYIVAFTYFNGFGFSVNLVNPLVLWDEIQEKYSKSYHFEQIE